MKIKNTASLAALLLAATSYASAQSLVAGWDFDQSLEASDTTYGATFSDFGTSDTEGGSSSNGTFTALTTAPRFNAGNQYNMSDNRTIDFNDDRTAVNDSFGFGGGVVFQRAGSGVPSPSFSLEATSGSVGFTSFEISLAAGLQNDSSANLELEYSFDNSSFTSFGAADSVTSTISSGGQTFTYSTGAVTAANTIYIRGLITGLDSNGQGMAFDNIQVGGTPIPEPSSFALLAGLVTIGLACSRRARR